MSADYMAIAHECGALVIPPASLTAANGAVVFESLSVFAAFVERIRAEEQERAAVKADAWSVPDNVKLAAGEMTLQELRTAQAVARGIAAAIRAPIRQP